MLVATMNHCTERRTVLHLVFKYDLSINVPYDEVSCSCSAVVVEKIIPVINVFGSCVNLNGFDDIQVVSGIPVEWTIIADENSLNGCNNEIVLSAFGRQVKLNEGNNTVSFTPEEPGEYLYSCWMGMLRSTITVVEEGGSMYETLE